MARKYAVEDILDVGIDLLRLQGYNKTGINDILRVSGIPKGSFYNFFENKQDFGLQAIDRYSQIVYSIMRSMLADTAYTPLERLRNYYRSMSERNIAAQFEKGCLLCNLATELGATDKALGIAIEAQYSRWVDLLTQCVTEGQALGEITTRFAAEEIATFLNNSYAGALVRMKASHSSAPLENFEQLVFEMITE